MTLFDAEFTADELAAERDEPRPGLWWERDAAPIQGDGRALEQHATDCLIVRELMRRSEGLTTVREIEQLRRVMQPWFQQVRVVVEPWDNAPTLAPIQWEGEARQQRGGVHSDPLTRVIARRVFGRRDLDWELQPICACCHEADLHPTRELIAQAQHRCDVAEGWARGGTEHCRCTMSREGVREASGPACTCTYFHLLKYGDVSRLRRVNCGGRRHAHQADCEKLRWSTKWRQFANGMFNE